MKTSLLVVALLAVYTIVHYVKESTCMYKLSPYGTKREKRINSVEKVQCNYTVHKALHVVSYMQKSAITRKVMVFKKTSYSMCYVACI